MERQSSTFTLLCANLAGHYFSSNDPPNLVGRLNAIVDHLQELPVLPDIVAVQELYCVTFVGLSYQSERDTFVTRMRELGYQAALFAPKSSWFGFDTGLGLFSKQRAELIASICFKDQVHRLSSKGAQKCLIPLGDDGAFRLVVVNAHLAWEECAAAQTKELCHLVGMDSNLLCGDFNRFVKGNEVNCRGDCVMCAATDKESTHQDGGCYDHVFLFGGIRAVSSKIIDWGVSDHKFLLVEFEQT